MDAEQRNTWLSLARQGDAWAIAKLAENGLDRFGKPLAAQAAERAPDYCDEARARNEARYSTRKLELLDTIDALDKAGFCAIPVPAKAKAPKAGWNKIHMTRDNAAQYLDADNNVGNRNGDPSEGKTDADLDWPEAVAAADVVFEALPSHGRASNPRSHRWAVVPESESVEFALPPSCKDDPRFGSEHALMIAEIRSTGSQTIMPGSIHESGERVEWTGRKLPDTFPTMEVDYHRKRCALIALTALTARCNPGQGVRNDSLLAFIGAAARIIPNAGLIDSLVTVICNFWHYNETRPQAETTLAKIAAGEECVGLPSLCERLGLPDDVTKHINAKWLPSNDKRPRVLVNVFDSNGTLDRVNEAMVAAGIPTYRRSGQIVHAVRLDKDSKGAIANGIHEDEFGVQRRLGSMGIHNVSDTRLILYLDKYMQFLQPNKDGKPKRMTAQQFGYIARQVSARIDECSLPVLDGIIECPTLRADGSLLVAQGYDRASRLLLDSGELSIPQIKERPTKEDAVTAMTALTNLLNEFPFQPDDEDKNQLGTLDIPSAARSVAIAGICTALVRRSLDRAPLVAVDAPDVASGKSTLCDVIAIVATGREGSKITLPENEEEAQKAWLSVLMRGDPVITVENIGKGKVFDGAVAARILTETTFTGRILGENTNVTVPTNVAILANGNNLTLGGDLASRGIKSRINPGIEHADHREFKRDIIAYTKEHRGEIVAAALTLMRAYVVAGRPRHFTSSRFKQWDELVRGAIIWAGQPDPMLTVRDIDTADPERTDLRTLLESFEQCFGGSEVTSKDITARTNQQDDAGRGLLAALEGLGARNAKSSITAALRSHVDKVVGSRRLRRRVDSSQVVHFRIEDIRRLL